MNVTEESVVLENMNWHYNQVGHLTWEFLTTWSLYVLCGFHAKELKTEYPHGF